MGDPTLYPWPTCRTFLETRASTSLRGSEGPTISADMDQKRNGDGVDLLKPCEDPNNIDPKVWNDFY